jgi:hypothetical protein
VLEEMADTLINILRDRMGIDGDWERFCVVGRAVMAAAGGRHDFARISFMRDPAIRFGLFID